MPALKERPKPFVLPEFCKGCGRCISACPKHCISMGTEINPQTGLTPVILDLEHCNGCGLCIDACPEPYGLRETPVDGDYELQDPAKLFGDRMTDAPEPVDIPNEIVPLQAMEPLVLKGNYAAAVGALLAGCRHFFGYPITPSTASAELMAKHVPHRDRINQHAASAVGDRYVLELMQSLGAVGRANTRAMETAYT